MCELISRWGWLAIFALAPVAFFSGGLWSLLLLTIPLVWLCRVRAGGPTLPEVSIHAPVLLLSVSVLLGLMFGERTMVSIERAAGYFYSVAFFYTVAELGARGRGWSWMVSGLFLMGGPALAGLALFGTDWLYKVEAFALVTRRLPPRLSSLVGPEGTFHPNIVAGALLLFLPPLLVSAGYLFRRWLRLGRKRMTSGASWIGATLLLASVFSLLVFVLLQSRAGYIGLGAVLVMLLMIGLARWREWSTWSLIALVVVSSLLLVAVVGLTFADQVGYSQGESLSSFFAQVSRNSTVSGRLELWGHSLSLFREHPLVGVGIGNFEPAVRSNYQLRHISREANFVHAHNHLLTVLAELGLVGLFGYSWLWLALGALWLRKWRQAERPTSHWLLLGFGGALVAHFVYGFLDTIALGTKPGVVFWYLLALLVSFAPARVNAEGLPGGLRANP